MPARPASDGNAVPPSAAQVPGAQAPLPGVDSLPPAQKPWPGVPVPAPPQAAGVGDPPTGGHESLTGEAAHQWDEIVIPAESVLGLQLESPLSSERSRVEDRVDARLTRDVRVGGRIAVPAGTQAIGSVVLVERGGKMKERARIGLRFNTLVMADATRVPITTETIYREGESPANTSSARIGGAAIGGAIIGAILGGGKGAAIGSGLGAAGGTAAALSGGRQQLVLPSGITLSVRTVAPITVTVDK